MEAIPRYTCIFLLVVALVSLTDWAVFLPPKKRKKVLMHQLQEYIDKHYGSGFLTSNAHGSSGNSKRPGLRDLKGRIGLHPSKTPAE